MGLDLRPLYVAHETASVGALYWLHARCKPRSVMWQSVEKLTAT